MLGKIWMLVRRPIGSARTNFHSIDLLRGLAAICVLIFHYKNFGGFGGGEKVAPAEFDRISLLSWLEPIRHNGSLAVMMFWMISGFVFMNVYAGTKPRASTFWINRVARLYPLHLLTLLIIALIQICAMREFGHWLIYPGNTPGNFVLHLFFASAWFGRENSFNGPIWSVSIEVLVYIIFYLYVRFVRVDTVTVALGLVASAAAMAVLHGDMIATCAAFFFGGMLIYAVYHLWTPGKRSWLLGLSLAMFVAFAGAGWAAGGNLPLPLTFWLLPIFGSVILVAATSEELALRGAYRRLEFIGDITYSTYLWHTPTQLLFLFGVGLGLWPLRIVFTDAFFLGYLLFVCLFAYASFKLIERPAQRLIRGWATGKRRDKPLIGAP